MRTMEFHVLPPDRFDISRINCFTKPLMGGVCALLLTGCATLGASGPTARNIQGAVQSNTVPSPKIAVIDLTASVVHRVMARTRLAGLRETLGDAPPLGTRIDRGDVVDISIWEAPPAALFGVTTADLRAPGGSVARQGGIPEQMVDDDGRVFVPFVGQLAVAGKTPAELEQDIMRHLSGIAHQPQAMVRIVRNASASVTVVGDVANSSRIALTPRGERLLDVIASSGGVRQPVGKTVVQVSRNGQMAALPLEQIIRQPAENIRLQPNDVITVLFQPFTFTALGAVGANAEIPFESTGITLAQALGRMGGLRDDRADVRGVFIYRLENPDALGAGANGASPTTPDGRVPVIYRINLRDPAAFFLAQGFPIRDKDVVYVSNAPGADLQKFVNIVSSMAFSIIGVSNAL